ncbi:uncharacterized protein TRUGW13939_02953 [Talaromyces rugulosus]|uniref:Zn(2)-C6 fungal-type domain-containing protein n=1 Tax=Talaromyces rugulosus TaxID=121627 RepID=A0A7H8QPG8_TALRU|nr:uncharacterized protein TRUGW13939_02953 [Talaromyces rugulosus]QKX55854.1 hypothetical protein TRUGW13939_02953 [Talaromyces rugulosus]
MSDDVPPAKRQRVGRACDPCRKRKSKCDGNRPCCLMCQSAGRICLYDDAIRRRGLQSGYVRGLEALLGLMLQRLPKTETQLEKLLRKQDIKDQLAQNKNAEKSARVWYRSAISKKINALLEPCQTEGEPGSPMSEDESPALDSLQIEEGDDHHDEINLGAESSVHIQHNGAMTCSTTESVEKNTPRLDDASWDIFQQPFPSNTVELVEEYFTYTHSWFPILERRRIMRAMHNHDPPLERNRRLIDIGYQMTLWAIAAYTSIGQSPRSQASGILDSRRIEACIRARAALDSQIFTLGHIQAILILVLLHLKLTHLRTAWILISQATRMVVMIDNNQRTERYTHVFHGCVILDNFISALLGTSPCLSAHEQTSHGLIEDHDEGLEEWDLWNPSSHDPLFPRHIVPGSPLRALSTFNLSFQLMCRVSNIYGGTCNEQHLQLTFEELQTWRSQLPSHCQWTGSLDSMKPPLLTLHLSWNFIMATALSRMTSPSPSLEGLCEKIVISTLDMSQKFIELTGINRAPPLIIGCVIQARRLLSHVASANCESTSTLDQHLSEVLENFRRQWEANEAHETEYQEFIIPQIDLRDIHGQNPMLHDSTDSSLIATITNYFNTDGEPFNAATEPSEKSHVFSDPTVPATTSSHTDQAMENGFDDLCEQMAASIPAAR